MLTRRRVVVEMVAVVAVLAVGLTSLAAFAEPLPPATTRRLLPFRFVVPGAPLRLPWPSSGESALASMGGTSLGSAGPAGPVPIGSVAKVMTAYLVLRDHPLVADQQGPTLTVTAAEAGAVAARVSDGQSVLPVRAGQKLSEYQCLQALLVVSANNIAAVLARFDAGTKAAFVDKMNAAAASLGMHQSHYADPSGYDPASASTARDQILLGRAALAIPTLAAIVASASVTLPGAGTVTNYNTLVGHDGFEGIKTGSTPAAGGCLLFAVTRDVAGRSVTVLGAVLGQRGGPYVAAAVSAARILADATFAALRPHTVLAAGTPALVVRQAGQRTVETMTGSLTTLAPPGTVGPISLDQSRVSHGSHPYATVSIGGLTSPLKVSVGASTPLRPPSPQWRLAHLAHEVLRSLTG